MTEVVTYRNKLIIESTEKEITMKSFIINACALISNLYYINYMYKDMSNLYKYF